MFWLGAGFVFVGFVLNMMQDRFWFNLAAALTGSSGMVLVGFSSKDPWATQVSWVFALIIMASWAVDELSAWYGRYRVKEKDGKQRFDA